MLAKLSAMAKMAARKLTTTSNWSDIIFSVTFLMSEVSSCFDLVVWFILIFMDITGCLAAFLNFRLRCHTMPLCVTNFKRIIICILQRTTKFKAVSFDKRYGTRLTDLYPSFA